MLAIMADHDIEGQVQLVLHLLMSPEWHALWTELAVRVESFASADLSINTPDAALWQFCQRQQIILITGNRNEDGPESLEAVLQGSKCLSKINFILIAKSLDDPFNILNQG